MNVASVTVNATIQGFTRGRQGAGAATVVVISIVAAAAIGLYSDAPPTPRDSQIRPICGPHHPDHVTCTALYSVKPHTTKSPSRSRGSQKLLNNVYATAFRQANPASPISPVASSSKLFGSGVTLVGCTHTVPMEVSSSPAYVPAPKGRREDT